MQLTKRIYFCLRKNPGDYINYDMHQQTPNCTQLRMLAVQVTEGEPLPGYSNYCASLL